MDSDDLTLRMISPVDPLAGDLSELIRYRYESEFFYDVEARETAAGFTWNLIRRPATRPIQKEHSWRPFEPAVANPRGYVAMLDGEPVGYAESAYDERWRLVRIWHFYVRESFRRQGVGRALLETTEQAARHFKARGIILETQTCNVPAIEFFRRMGFELWGINTAAYANEDIEAGEVFLWLGKRL